MTDGFKSKVDNPEPFSVVWNTKFWISILKRVAEGTVQYGRDYVLACSNCFVKQLLVGRLSLMSKVWVSEDWKRAWNCSKVWKSWTLRKCVLLLLYGNSTQGEALGQGVSSCCWSVRLQTLGLWFRLYLHPRVTSVQLPSTELLLFVERGWERKFWVISGFPGLFFCPPHVHLLTHFYIFPPSVI